MTERKPSEESMETRAAAFVVKMQGAPVAVVMTQLCALLDSERAQAREAVERERPLAAGLIGRWESTEAAYMAGKAEAEKERDEARAERDEARALDEQNSVDLAASLAMQDKLEAAEEGWEAGESVDEFAERLDHYIRDLDTEADIEAGLKGEE